MRSRFGEVNVGFRTVKVGAFPISIDSTEMDKQARSKAIRQRAREIRDPPFQSRHGHGLCGVHAGQPGAQAEQAQRDAQPHHGAGVAGAGVELKSTVGGREMAASFSTEKFGLTSWSNIFAVRLVGNDRTVEL